MFLKLFLLLFKLFGDSFHIIVCPVYESRDMPYSLTGQGKSPIRSYSDCCLGQRQPRTPTFTGTVAQPRR